MKIRRLVLPFVMLLLMLAACGCQAPAVKDLPGIAGASPCNGIAAGKGQYLFNDTLGNADRPITVYTYCPKAWNTSGPVLIVMPGAGRTGSPPRDTWIPYAEKYAALVVVPEFSQHYYPGDQWYAGGNTYDAENWQPKRNWTYLAIEHIFDDIRAKSGATTPTYLFDGHSAGAQFVHRMVTLLPEARYSRAVAANAGVYLLPDFSVPYAFGLKDSPVYENQLPSVFAKKLIILSGDTDTNPNDSGLANFPEAEAQGITRFERAKFYYATAQKEAGRLGVPLNWEYHVVPGVGHDEGGMAGPSAELLFTGT